MASTILNAARFASTHAAPLSAGKHKIVVVGGGAGGLAVANQLYNKFKSDGQTLASGDIAIVDGAKTHHYQPGWTLVGAGIKDKESFARPLDSLINSEYAHLKSHAKTFNPSSNSLILENGDVVKYDYLVVATGLKTKFDAVKGLEDALANPHASGVSSIYSYDTCDKTWDLIEGLKSGKAIFTQPFGPVKCAGAPQKMLHMSWDRWQKTGRGDAIKSEFVTGLPVMFGIPYYNKPLDALRQERGIPATFNSNLIEIKKNVAIFQGTTGEKSKIEKEFDFLHVVPPQGPLDAIKNSPLADAAGWVDVDKITLQSTKFENVFSLGDASSLPTSKTAAAITAEAPVLVENLSSLMETGSLGSAAYDGYASCPLTTSYDKVLLAEFSGYSQAPMETFGKLVDQRKPSKLFMPLVKTVFPEAYFRWSLKGQWYGPRGLIAPQYVPKVVPS